MKLTIKEHLEIKMRVHNYLKDFFAINEIENEKYFFEGDLIIPLKEVEDEIFQCCFRDNYDALSNKELIEYYKMKIKELGEKL